MERYLRTKTTTYSLASYSRAHDYDAPQAGKTTAQWKDTWIHQTLHVALDQVTTEGNDTPTTLRLRVITGGSGVHASSSSSQVPPDQVHEDIDLTMFQKLLRDVPSRQIIDQNGLPVRVAFRGSQVVFRYQHPILPPTVSSVVYRRFQLMFTTASDVPKFVAAISRVCYCTDHSDDAKAARKKKAPVAYMNPPVFGTGSIPPSTLGYHSHHEARSSSDHYPPSSQRQLRPVSPGPAPSYRIPSSPVESQLFFAQPPTYPLPVTYWREQHQVAQGDRLGRDSLASGTETTDPSPTHFDQHSRPSIMEEDSQQSLNDYADYGQSQWSSNSGHGTVVGSNNAIIPALSTSSTIDELTLSSISKDRSIVTDKISRSGPAKAIDETSVKGASNANIGQHYDERPLPMLVESISAALASTTNPLCSLSKSEMNRIIFEVVSGDGFAELVRVIHSTIVYLHP